MRRGLLPTLAVTAALAGCGDDDRANAPRGAAAIAAAPVALRADLAGALDERAWLTAVAARSTLLDGADAPTAIAARSALDTGSVALSKALERAVGGTRARRALATLRREDALRGDLAAARATGDATARAAAAGGLAATRDALARTLAPKASVARELRADLRAAATTMDAALAAVAAGRAVTPVRVATAAARAVRPAAALANLGRSDADGGAARAVSPAGELAALAAAAFTDLAYAQAALSTTLAAGVTDGPRLAAARRAVTGSADALGQLMASVHGEDAGSRFGDLWQDRATALEAYATAQGTDDPAAAATALTALTRVRAGIAGLLDEVDPDGAARPLQRALAAQADAATATVRAIVARSPKLGPRLLDAARASREVGRALVVRFATRFPKRFPAS